MAIAGDKPIGSYSVEDMHCFRDVVDQIPVKAKQRFRTDDPLLQIKLNSELAIPVPQIDPVSVDAKYLSPIKTLFTISFPLASSSGIRSTASLRSGSKEKTASKSMHLRNASRSNRIISRRFGSSPTVSRGTRPTTGGSGSSLAQGFASTSARSSHLSTPGTSMGAGASTFCILVMASPSIASGAGSLT
ncbi:hypothetical protein [Aurantimonas sp. 22II-16-19i]|uniref:hypothetical protein n=1 Tax=Aurantimonas sp. 22II-16-19i TaxID=1317114 RepID=UPI00111C40A2|nr:hypothetical protein [Aurantimonas sp. 22II-16-19i]